MLRRPPRATRTDTRFPYPTLFRSVDCDRLWIAMQFVDGLDAAQLLRQGLSVLTPERAVRIVAEAAKGLDYAHRQGLLHRDIKRSEEHTSELQSLMRISYAVFCLKKKKN